MEVSTLELATRVAAKMNTDVDTILDVIDCVVFETRLDLKTGKSPKIPGIGMFYTQKCNMRCSRQNIIRFAPFKSFSEAVIPQ